MERTILPFGPIESLSSFAEKHGQIQYDGKIIGRLLVICGQEYEAHFYDQCIYAAIELAKRWKPNEVTFQRITWLRDWIREDVQHGHNFGFRGIRSMAGVSRRITELIEREYGNDPFWKESKDWDTARNKEIFS